MNLVAVILLVVFVAVLFSVAIHSPLGLLLLLLIVAVLLLA